MPEARYIDPNSGAAPQPGGSASVVVLEDAEEVAVTDQDAEVQRQNEVTEKQEEAKQGEEGASDPAEAKTPDLEEPTTSSKKK